MDGLSSNLRRRPLQVAVAGLLSELGYEHAEKMAHETLIEVVQSIICQVGISARSFCELSGRTEPVIGDVIIALVNMGLPLEGIEIHARRAGRTVLPALGPSTQPKQLSILQAGLKQPHPQHIPVHLPQFPDPHAYIRTPTHKQPVTEYEAIREKSASQKRDTERALTRFVAKTSETHSLFLTEDTIFPCNVFRYSYEAQYVIFEVQTSRKVTLKLGDSDVDSHPFLQHVVWAPRGNALAFVYRNDIYYKTSAVTSHVYRVTNTGRPGVVFNGVPDWLYEEEILKSPNALWFSPDAQFLLYACFNDSQVGELKYPWYGRIEERLRYPQIRMLRYPKVGTRNPAATLWVVDLSRPSQLSQVDLKPPPLLKHESQAEWDHYFTAVTWLVQHHVAVIWMNRVQNISIISLCQGPVWNCELTEKFQAEPNGWVELYDAPLFSSDGSYYLARLPVLEGEHGFYKHVCHIDFASKRITPLTQGRFEVTQILAWDEENHCIYFVAAPEHKPGERHLYRTGDLNISSPDTREMDCLTCPPPEPSQSPPQHGLGSSPNTVISGDISPDYNASELASWPPCLYVAPHLSPGLSPRFYVLECLGPDPPSASLVDLWSNTKLAILDTQPALRDRLASMASPQVKTIKVLVEGGYHAQVRLHLPPGLREDEEMTFPLILHVCGAPGSQLVSEQWSVDWGTYLASNRNFIVAQIDGRGSGFQGDRLRHELHYRLGSVEIEDQIAVTKYLRDQKFVDRERIAVWGWSYGGFAAAMILSQDKEVFRCGISVAPITSWTHYDSVYTERYMGTPNVTDNYRGYEEADVTKRAGNLQNKLFLLIHGTADHTVHYQQSMMLVRALTEQGVLFRHQTYADEGHSFSGVQHHLYNATESFLDDCFGPLDFEEWEFGTSFFTFKQ